MFNLKFLKIVEFLRQTKAFQNDSYANYCERKSLKMCITTLKYSWSRISAVDKSLLCSIRIRHSLLLWCCLNCNFKLKKKLEFKLIILLFNYFNYFSFSLEKIPFKIEETRSETAFKTFSRKFGLSGWGVVVGSGSIPQLYMRLTLNISLSLSWTLWPITAVLFYKSNHSYSKKILRNFPNTLIGIIVSETPSAGKETLG